MRLRTALIVAVGVLGATAAQAEIIDRVLAVVSGQIITKSDVEAAMALGLADEKPEGGPIADGLQALIDRVLMLNEVRRVVPPEPSDAAVEARVTAIRARFQSPQALARTLEATGINEDVLRLYAADDLRLAAYLDERFSSASQPTDQEVRQTGEASRQRLADERRGTLVSAWIAELRRRADITVLGPT